ncbi:MAG: phosphoribosylglycinamide formyltransferase [Pseudomonadota bacterium]
MKKNLVILISGRGSNMQAIVQACAQQAWNAHIAAVVSNRPQAGGLDYARQQGVPTAVVDHTTFASRDAFDQALADEVLRHAPDLVVLAGFMRILTPAFVQRFEGRLLNVHPSLLPAFPGLHTHARALEAGCQVAGATVHYVTAELDHGPIVAQAVVPVLAHDTPDTLARRVLEQEHRMVPQAVRWAVEGSLRIEDGRVHHAHAESRCWNGLNVSRAPKPAAH